MTNERVLEKIANGKKIKTVFSIMDERVEHSVRFIVEQVLNHYNREDMIEATYTALKEIIINGVKANLKHHVFQEMVNDPHSEEQIRNALASFKQHLNENDMKEYRKIANRENLKVTLTVKHSADHILFKVENNTKMTQDEDRRVKEKFERALKYENIAEFYMDAADDTEGTGLGITMIVIMLKNVGVDPHVFSVHNIREQITSAKFSIPLEELRRNEREMAV